MTTPDPMALLALTTWSLGSIGLLFGAFALRRQVGLSLLCVVLGCYQPLQLVLSTLFYVEVLPGIAVSPGSVAMFPAVLATVLLVYLREDALGVRQVVYAVVAATLVTLIAAWSMIALRPLVIGDMPGLAPLFDQQWRINAAGTCVLVLDIVLMLWLYERLPRLGPLLRLWATLAAALLFDAVAFSALAFAGTPLLDLVLWPGLVTKQLVAPLLAVLLWIYLQRDLQGVASLHGNAHLNDVFAALSYRQRYELQRAMAEDAMDRADRVHRAMLGSTTEALLGIDDNGVIWEANRGATEILGKPLAELVGQPLAALVDTPQLLDPTRQSHLPDQHWHGLEARLPDAPERQLELWLTPLDDPVGDVCQVVTLRDVTERRQRFDRELQHSRLESLGRLAGGVAHDFNNQLTVMLGAATLLEQDATLGADQQRQATAIREAAVRGSELTGRLLTFARRQSLPPAVVAVAELLRQLEDMLQRLCGDEVELILAVDPETPAVWISRTQLEQAVVNLVTNARDASADGGQVRVACAPLELDGPWACISVSDTGVGMSAEQLGKVFDPFYTTKAEGEGTGMGLAMALSTIQQADGHLEVDSTPDQGSTFRILLPATDTAERRDQRTRPAPGGQGNGEQVLVVDDDAAVAEVARLALEAAGYRVTVAHSAAAALDCMAAAGGPPDLLLTDVVMPEQRGDQLVRTCAERGWACPVVFMTGHATGVSMGDRQLRGHPVLHKPFSLADLQAVVAAQLRG